MRAGRCARGGTAANAAATIALAICDLPTRRRRAAGGRRRLENHCKLKSFDTQTAIGRVFADGHQAHGHQLGHCRGARPSRLPFPASRPPKAPEGWRTPRRFAPSGDHRSTRQRLGLRWPSTAFSPRTKSAHKFISTLPRSSNPSCLWSHGWPRPRGERILKTRPDRTPFFYFCASVCRHACACWASACRSAAFRPSGSKRWR